MHLKLLETLDQRTTVSISCVIRSFFTIVRSAPTLPPARNQDHEEVGVVRPNLGPIFPEKLPPRSQPKSSGDPGATFCPPQRCTSTFFFVKTTPP